ncbi:MAG: DNA/RNA non-specific endonuclease [bacterium]
MRSSTIRMLRSAALGLALVACNSDRVLGPSAALPVPVSAATRDVSSMAGAGPSVRISEFHYDHPGTDVVGTEKIEISGPAGTDLAGWQIVRYNGANPAAGAVYTSPGTTTVTGTIVQSCGTRGVLVFSYTAGDALQNGGNDGFALVSPTNQVVEFLSYEGTMVASNGPAAGMTSVDVGVAENGAAGTQNSSIQRQPDGSWILTPAANTFGTCNDDDSSNPPPPIDHITVSPSTASILVGATQQFTATAFDVSNQPITGINFTWTSSNSASATVDASGLATGVAAGNTNIVATSGSVSGSGALQVDAAVVDHIVVAPSDVIVTNGSTQQFTATAFDAANNPIPSAVFVWASSNTAVATVNSTGLATGVGVGDANITATSGAATGTGVLHVTVGTPYIPPDIRFSEIHYDNTGTDAGEAIEIEGPVGTSLNGYSIVLYEGNPTSATSPLKVYNTVAVTGSLTAPVSCNGRGVISIPIAGIQNGGTNGSQPDGFALADNNGQLVEFLSYEGSFTAADGVANGVASRDIVVMEDNPVPAAGLSLHRSADGKTWAAPAPQDFGFVNSCGTPPPPQFNITFSGRATPADPPLPVGFEAQIFATEHNGNTIVNTTFTWSSDTPAIATIDQDGVFTAVTAGTAVLRATATDGTTATYPLPTVVATQSAAPYGGNTEFGDPVDGDPSDDFIIRRAEYTSSFNKNLGRPNWVSMKLDASTYGAEDRCNCFTYDPELIAAGFPRYTTADYTGAGAFAGFGIDRGHMTRSADRTAGNLDNARTFYFSNVLPQAAANNQVTWKLLEDTLGTIAQNQGKEVYVIAGGSSSAAFPSKGFVKGQHKIEMPGTTWKVAVIMDHGKGLADVHSVADVQIIAVIMPNDPSINSDWHVYKTTVDAVEALSGYDLLSLLPDNIENQVEANDRPPVARVTGATSGNEGATLSFDASTSSDPDVGDVLTYSWNFGDGTTGTGAMPTHVYADNGNFTVTVTVTDSHNVSDVATLNVLIANVAPVITNFSVPSPAASASASATVSFTDGGSADTHTAIISWGDGATSTVNAGLASQATATHAYASAGFYTVGVTVSDDDGATATTSSQQIVVYSAAAGYVQGSGLVLGPGSSLNARATFSADVRYVGSNTAPTGTFTIAASPLIKDLTSNALEYLVVNGNSGIFKGTGTLSDGTPVRFIVSGLDFKTSSANPDKIRIKVWNASTSAVLYDTQPGAADLAVPTTVVRNGTYTIKH